MARLRDLDVDATIARLREAGLLADLEGVTVSVIGAAYNVDRLRYRDREVLRQFWRRNVRGAGGEIRWFRLPQMSGRLVE